MLAAAVDPGERFLMQQAYQAVFCSYLLHDFHGQLVVVGRHIGGSINRGKFMLRGSHLVMLCLGQDAQFPEFPVELFHVSGHSGLDDAEVVIIHFLPLGRFCPEQCPSGKAKIRALIVHFLRDQEVFLLRSHGGADTFYRIVAEEPQDAQSLFVQSLHGTKEGCLLI